ncbi:SDR family oxidoreductase [Phenylobacterium sp. LjRoot225]|uniref:SDR family oxidoreductase n=1 Tax=Phenylobacterium sp. LjRoot225 TaxID=3342285 RepID=UPI003ECF6C30
MARTGVSARADWPLAVVVSAGGMGMAAARRLSQRHRVLVADVDEALARSAAETLCAEGGDTVSFACDITQAAEVDQLCERVAQLGGFRVLAHVAGLSPSMGDFRSIMRVNLLGAIAVAEGLRPHAPVGGAAVLISSLAGHNANLSPAVTSLLRQPGERHFIEKLAAELGDEVTPGLAYVLSKWALMAYVRRQARPWGERGARIVSLSPGLIATPQGAREFVHSPGKMALFERLPLGREGTMLEIADAIEFLASDRASFISGTDLLVDGGLLGALTS